MQVLLVGCGKMGGALLSRWATLDAFQFTVVDPVVAEVPTGVRLVSEASALSGSKFDAIVVALKPQMIDDVMPVYSDHLATDGIIFSIAAGYAIERLSKLMNAPVIRIMPNLPAAIGKGVSGLYRGLNIDAHHVASLEELMSTAGDFVWVDSEDKLDREMAIAGSGPGFIFEICRAYVASAVELGFSEDEARTLVLGTIAGTVEMAQTSDESLAELRNAVTSKGGTTAEGLKALNGDGQLDELMKDMVKAAYERAIELR